MVTREASGIAAHVREGLGIACGGCIGLFLVLATVAVAGRHWGRKRRRLPNWVLCLLCGAGFALVGVVMGALAADSDWGATLGWAASFGGLGLLFGTLGWPPIAHQ